MKTEFKMSSADLKLAIEEYFNKRGLRGSMKVFLHASPGYTITDQPTGGYDVSATVEVDVVPERLKI